MGKRRRTSSSSSDSSSSDSSDQDSRSKLKRQVDSTSSSEDEDDWNERSNSKKKLKKTTKTTAKKVTKLSIKESEDDSPIGDEKEEGEVDDDDDEFNDGYDENLMGDEEDQKRLLLMTEKEREQELFNRSEKREVLKTRFEIEKKLRLAKKKEQNKISFTDATLRSTDRRKTLENNRKQKDGLKQLKEQREKRKQKAKLRASDVYSSSDDDSDNERNQRRKSSSSSSESSSDESSSDERRRKSDDDLKQEQEEEPYELDSKRLNTIRLSRHKLSRWCHSPFFKETVIGCFVRLSIGVRESVPLYRIAEIVDVCDGLTAYELEDTKTAKTLRLKHGRDESNFKIKFASNTEFTEREFSDWKAKMERDRVSLPTKKHIDDKIKSITAAMNYNFKDSDVDAIVKEKEKYAQQPINFAMKKTQLKKDKDMAEQRGDHKRVEEITQQLENLEQQARDLDYKRTQKISAISYINERNRHSNIIEAEKAILLAREQDKLNQGDDPFRRRKCAPMLVNVTKNKHNVVKVEDTVDASAKASANNVPAVQNGKSQTAKSKEDNKQTEIEQNDLFEAHDFDIQIDFDITSNLTSTSNNSLSNSFYSSNQSSLLGSANKSANRRSLNLEEYKKKKGLI